MNCLISFHISISGHVEKSNKTENKGSTCDTGACYLDLSSLFLLLFTNSVHFTISLDLKNVLCTTFRSNFLLRETRRDQNTNLVGERETTHTRLDAEDVVVGREHVHGGRSGRVQGHRDLSVVNAGEVASTSWLVFFWLKREGVRVDTWSWAASVVVVWLHLVEVLTLLGLEAVLAVEDKLEFGQWTRVFFGVGFG